MANQLKMAVVSAILTLKQRGWSQRRIARELGIDRETVARYVNLPGADPKPATNAPPGSGRPKPATTGRKIAQFKGWDKLTARMKDEITRPSRNANLVRSILRLQ